jgi:hypothetical protein
VSDDLNPVEETEVPATEQEVADATPDTNDVGALMRALEREREERRQAKEELRRIREDETARTELLKEWGYEVAEDEVPDEELFDDEDPVAPVRSEVEDLKQWRAEVQREKIVEAFDKQVDKLAEGSEWELEHDDRQWIWDHASRTKNGLSVESIQEAHKALIARYERIAESAVERAKKPRPKAPHVTPGGEPATEVRNLDDHSERVKHMLERMQGGPAI